MHTDKKNKNNSTDQSLFLIGAHLWLILFLLIPSCARIPSGVHLSSDSTPKHLDEKYPASYISRGPGGDYHVLCLKDGSPPSWSQTPGTPLKPLELDNVRQILHIHVFWIPMQGAKPDNPSATNAAIDWYLVRALPDGSITGLAHYEGAGFVTTNVGGDDATVTVRSAALKPARIQGDLSDPLGPFHLTARFDAQHRPGSVTDILAQLDTLRTTSLPSPQIDAAKLTQPATSARN